MKTFLQVLLILLISLPGMSQHDLAKERQDFIAMSMDATRQPYNPSFGPVNKKQLPIRIPVRELLQPASIKKMMNQQVSKSIAPAIKMKPLLNTISNPVNPLCIDSSFTKLLGVTHAALYVESVTQTMDGGMLVPGIMYDTTTQDNRRFGMLLKLDENGSIVWIKQFDNNVTDVNYVGYAMTRAFELSNKDIICAGMLNKNPSNNRDTTVVYRLNSMGNTIWKNTLKSTIGIFNSPSGTFRFGVKSAIDGLNGDVILGGTTNANISSGTIETVVRLNNQGQVVWDANYGNHGIDGSYLFGAEGVAVFLQNNQIVLAGLSHGSNNPSTAPAINFLTLDYSNGTLLSKRFFKPTYADPWEEAYKSFTYYYNECIRLSTGHYLFYGKLLSGYVNMTSVIDHFGVVEFDAAFNLVDAYTINSDIIDAYHYFNLLHFEPSGRGLVSLFRDRSAETDIYFGAFQNKQFQNQRKVNYAIGAMPGFNGFAFVKDNGYAFLQSYQVLDPDYRSFIEFRKMHNSDTASECMGKDTMVLNFSPLTIVEDPNYFFLDANEPNKMVSPPQLLTQSDTLTHNSINPCKQSNYCDTVKIHGNPVICGISSAVLFTAFKNAACGGIVQWNINNNVIDSFHVMSDSSVFIWFKNTNWQGKLYATLPAGRATYRQWIL